METKDYNDVSIAGIVKEEEKTMIRQVVGLLE